MTTAASRRLVSAGLLAVLASATGGPSLGHDAASQARGCDYRPPVEHQAGLRDAIQRGEVDDPRTWTLPRIERAQPRGAAFPDGEACLSTAHVFPYEDSERILLSEYTRAQLDVLTARAANALLAEHGDRFDFIGFWMNFDPANQFGLAFYDPLFNDVEGIGDASIVGTPIFDARPERGIASSRVNGFVVMYDVNAPWWGTEGSARDFTRLAISHELEHRWAMFLPPVTGGRWLEGDGNQCGRFYHWSFKVDGQGSAMEIADWAGTNPATLVDAFTSFNTDTGGVFSYPDLYLMGYVTPEEMDAGMSEFRYMDQSNCSSPYFGPIYPLNAAEIIQAVGPRMPDSTASQKHFRAAWIMIHQPGDPPQAADLERVVDLLSQNQSDWYEGTLERGTINHQLFDDCDCDDVPDADAIATGAARDSNGNDVPDHCEVDCGAPDCDMDGVTNVADNCILVTNPDQSDRDDDAVGDACDNCPGDANGPQADSDEDGFGDVCDTCLIAANPDQQPAVLGQTLEAPNADRFCWAVPTDVAWVRGPLAQVAAYATGPIATVADSDCFFGDEILAPGEGHFYLVKPDCESASWQSDFGREPARDQQLP